MGDIHTCSYHCDRPECVKAQRDELREALVNAAPDIEMRAHITALESALKVCEEHTRGIFGAAHPVTIAIQQVKR